MPRPRTPEDLRKFSDGVLLYEFEMLSATALRSVKILTGEVGATWWESNAFLESALIHARQLAHFFFESGASRGRKRAKGSDDTVATDFFDDPHEWWDPRPKRPDELRDGNLNRISREVAHTNFERRHLKDAPRGHAVYAMFSAIADVMETFVEAVDPERVIPDFGDRVQAAQPLKQPPPPKPHRPAGYMVGPSAWVGATQTSRQNVERIDDED